MKPLTAETELSIFTPLYEKSREASFEPNIPYAALFTCIGELIVNLALPNTCIAVAAALIYCCLEP